MSLLLGAFSVLIALLTGFEKPTFSTMYRSYRLSRLVIASGIALMTSFFIISIAIYTIIVRNTHIKRIKAIEFRFGIEAERLDMLTKLKDSIRGVWRLNICTASFLTLTAATALLSIYDAQPLQVVFAPAIFFTTLSNPLTFVLTQSELRNEFYKLIHLMFFVERRHEKMRVIYSLHRSHRIFIIT